ncbi:hypothetical protein BAUCODRAFT_147964 [Baudoinia panamericana UAMH 10762]|uniref:Uncharacterized protein n=1 Tax=Baudoinia panamericana (strain UAMH 10762) TaxID=717646 RepID=M2MI50_BAUPA|nr:uncharacterized protein BAUCODRAFT_147964 [Baudoinia panamericana UAMH 10762]EMC96336.1 hypothetical protein BAUCODRAFT_147964 [Baudoinia panamericana UAMH 10762]
MADYKADEVASSAGGQQQDRSSTARKTAAGDGRMENSLEMNKANKVETTEASDVAGRKDKGTGTGRIEKLMPGKK